MEPVDQRADRRVFLIFDDGCVVERAHQGPTALELLEKALVVDFEAERLGSCIEIGAIDEQRNLAGGRRHSVVTSITLDRPTSRLSQPVLDLGQGYEVGNEAAQIVPTVASLERPE